MSEQPTERKRSIATYNVSLLARREIAEHTMAFDFDKPAGFDFQPGQAVSLSIPDMTETDERGPRRSLSIASAPTDETLSFAMRMRDTAFKRTLKSTPIGTVVKIAGPTGRFMLDADRSEPIAMIAGGIGITPFRSMLRAKPAQHKREIYFFYSNRNPATAAYIDELTRLAEDDSKLHLVPTYTDEGLSAELSGERGFIDLPMLRRHLPDLTGADYYIAGTPQMAEEFKTLLTGQGVAEANIHLDEFIGY